MDDPTAAKLREIGESTARSAAKLVRYADEFKQLGAAESQAREGQLAQLLERLDRIAFWVKLCGVVWLILITLALVGTLVNMAS